MSGPPRQIPLALEHRPALGRSDFLVSGSNADAVRLISAWRKWPGRRFALSGPDRAGKTHLAHVWRQETGAACIEAAALDEAEAARLARHGFAVIEDVDRLAGQEAGRRYSAERALFHLWNLTSAEGGWLLLTGRTAPARWQVALPDLASRLSALPHVRLAPPDDRLLSSLMVKLFADRQLRVQPGVISHLAQRVERSFAAAEAAVAALDRLALARKRKVSRAMVLELFGDAERTEGND